MIAAENNLEAVADKLPEPSLCENRYNYLDHASIRGILTEVKKALEECAVDGEHKEALKKAYLSAVEYVSDAYVPAEWVVTLDDFYYAAESCLESDDTELYESIPDSWHGNPYQMVKDLKEKGLVSVSDFIDTCDYDPNSESFNAAMYGYITDAAKTAIRQGLIGKGPAGDQDLTM